MRGQGQLAGEPPGRIPPLSELVNVFEVEAMAKRKLTGAAFSSLADGGRAELERYTFRPRMMVDTTSLNLSTELFGVTMFAPIMIGPASDQRRFYSDGELAMVRGAAAAKAVTMVACDSSFPLEKIAAEAKEPFWYQVYADLAESESQALRAVELGARALAITVRDPGKLDWQKIDQLRSIVSVPVVLKGVMRPADAEEAVRRGLQAIVVSNHGSEAGASPMSMLPSVVEVISGRIPVLIDGGFRRGTDVLKALILGARAVLVTRPPLWGLAAYGAEGVQAVMEMLQTELARNMIMIGAAGTVDLHPNMLRIHKR
jgi:4-hydroxymandelate oxidase